MPDGPLFEIAGSYVKGRVSRGEISRVTAKAHRIALTDFCRTYGRRPVDRLSRSDVERWLTEMVARGQQPSTRRARLSVLRGFCRWLVREGKIRRNPCDDLPKIRQPRTVPVVFEGDEVAAILDACPDARARLIVLLTVQAGLRCIEISRLELGDLDHNRTHATVTGKGGHQRVVWLPAELRLALEEYLATERGGTAGPLIVNRKRPGMPLTSGSLSKRFAAWASDAGVRRYPHDGKSAHGGRRTCVTDLLESDVPVEVVAEVIGHKGLENLNRYARVRAERLRPAMEGRWYGRGRVIEMEQTG